MQRIFQHYQRKKLIFVLIAMVFLLNPVFAADVSQGKTTEALEFVKQALFWVGDVSSWIWIVLGNLAGKLMTNTFVYGEFMELDRFLWKGWQITRTFANYAIGFLFAYSLFKYILFPSEKSQTPMKTIKELLIASVLVQASWFLVMVVVDISTVSLATISSFPSQVIANSSYSQNAVITQIKKNKILGSAIKKDAPEAVKINPFVDVFDKTNKQLGIEMVPLVQTLDEKTLIDTLLPKPDNLAGPLTYLGFTVFKTHEFLKEYHISDANTVEQLTKIIISLIFDAGTIILFSLALAVLVIVLIMRLVYLWVFIVASPIIVLMAVSKVVDLGKVSEFLDLKKILSLIFKPVFFALRMSVMFLVVVVMQGFFNVGSGDFSDAIKVKETRRPTIDGASSRYTSELQVSELVKVSIYQGTKSFQDIVLSLLTLAMMWYLVKLAILTKTGTAIDGFTKGVADIASKGLGNIGVIPTPAGTIGFKQLWNNGSSPIVDTGVNTYLTRLQEGENKDQKALAEMFGAESPVTSLTAIQHQELQRAVDSSEVSAFPQQIAQQKQKNGGIKFGEIKQYIPQWIAKNRASNKLNALKTYLGDCFVRDPRFEILNERDLAMDELFTSNPQVFQTFYKKVLGGTKSDMTYQRLKTTEGTIKGNDS